MKRRVIIIEYRDDGQIKYLRLADVELVEFVFKLHIVNSCKCNVLMV